MVFHRHILSFVFLILIFVYSHDVSLKKTIIKILKILSILRLQKNYSSPKKNFF